MAGPTRCLNVEMAVLIDSSSRVVTWHLVTCFRHSVTGRKFGQPLQKSRVGPTARPVAVF